MTRLIALEQFGSPRSEDDDANGANLIMPVAAPEPADAPEAKIDPEVEAAACLARITNALEIIASEQATLRARCIGDAVKALGAAAETLLPRLAQAGFATIVAETAQTIARRGRWPELQLSVAPANAAGLTIALGAFRPETEIKIAVDPQLGPGEVQIAWSQGGAEIDIEAIAEAAIERFRIQLDGCAQQGAN